MTKEDDQIVTARAIFAGAIQDKDGYCGCPNCGSRDLIHDGRALDESCIRCINCSYGISGGEAYGIIARWNLEHRTSFQLQIIFVESCFH